MAPGVLTIIPSVSRRLGDLSLEHRDPAGSAVDVQRVLRVVPDFIEFNGMPIAPDARAVLA
jgi:hypothetical protein